MVAPLLIDLLMESAGAVGSSLRILVLGESGVGKSQVLDKIFGRKISKTSRGRFQIQEFEQAVSGRHLHVLEASGLSKPSDFDEIRKLLIKRRLALDLIIYVDRAGILTNASLELLRAAQNKLGRGLWGVTMFVLTHDSDTNVIVADERERLKAEWVMGVDAVIKDSTIVEPIMLTLPEIVMMRIGEWGVCNHAKEEEAALNDDGDAVAVVVEAAGSIVRSGNAFVVDVENKQRWGCRPSTSLSELGNFMDNNLMRAERICEKNGIARRSSSISSACDGDKEKKGRVTTAVVEGGVCSEGEEEKKTHMSEEKGRMLGENVGSGLMEVQGKTKVGIRMPVMPAAASLSLALHSATLAVTPLLTKSLAELAVCRDQSFGGTSHSVKTMPILSSPAQRKHKDNGVHVSEASLMGAPRQRRSAEDKEINVSGASGLKTLAAVHAPTKKTASSGAAVLGAAAASLQLGSVVKSGANNSSAVQSEKKAGRLSAFPDFQRLPSLGRDSAEPKAGAGARKASLVWFRNDLRVHDNEALLTANKESLSILCVYCFDPRDYGKSSSGFDKTGPYRAKFLLECVTDLRKNLRQKGNDLVVRIGKPEEVIGNLAREVGAEAVYAHQEVTYEELEMERKVAASLKEEGLEAKYFWGSTLYHLEDLPFKLEDMPSNYSGFREKVQNLQVRTTAQAPDSLRPLPARGGVKVGDIPTLQQLGLNVASTTVRQDPPQGSTTPFALVGGETEAIRRLQTFVGEASGQKKPESTSGENLYGANFSCKISPWLAMGCLSPRKMYEDLNRDLKAAKGRTHATSAKGSGSADESNGMNWLVFELLWRDFFRFITKKYGSGRREQEQSPTLACAAV